MAEESDADLVVFDPMRQINEPGRVSLSVGLTIAQALKNVTVLPRIFFLHQKEPLYYTPNKYLKTFADIFL